MVTGKLRRKKKMVLTLICLLAAVILAGMTRTFLDGTGSPLPGSLSQKIRIPINGSDMGMFIESKNIANPVLLFLHGGPGMPSYWMTRQYPTGLEDYFTVVWWEQRAYEYALDRYREKGDKRMLRKLEAAPPSLTVPLPQAYTAMRDTYMHDLGIGTTREMKSVITGIFLPSLRFPGYTLTEKINLWRGKILSRSIRFGLWETMLATDLPEKIKELAVPVYFFHGRHDYTCDYFLAKVYIVSLEAPMKGFYTFENSAHSPLLEEPAKARSILHQDVLGGENSLADPDRTGDL
jgi:pimeloyl-ACP methyl ester carboxylesterase